MTFDIYVGSQLDHVGGWERQLMWFLMLALYDELRRLRAEGKHGQADTLLHILAWTLGAELGQASGPATPTPNDDPGARLPAVTVEDFVAASAICSVRGSSCGTPVVVPPA